MSTRSIFHVICLTAGLLCLTGMLFIVSHSVRTYRSFPIDSKETIMNRRDTGLTLYDRHGQLFFTFDRAQFKQFIPRATIPDHVQAAIITAEDQNFYNHHGLSLSGIVRSLYLNYHLGHIQYGGSTITQQLVKSAYFSSEKNVGRKFVEALLAVKIERHFTKNEILEMYLNSAYFGQNVFGIEAAAQTYFGKEATSLTVGEAALLAAILPTPSALASNITTPTPTTLARQQLIIKHMYEKGYISAPEKIAAEITPLYVHQHSTGINEKAPHFALLVRDEIYANLGREAAIRQGLHVTTTLDLTLQAQAETALRQHIQKLTPQHASNGAIVMQDPSTGQVHALVGSVDWHQESFGKINMATHPRQTGSAIKPLVYAAAFEDGAITPATILVDRPRTFGADYRPKNFDRRFRGPVSVRYALSNSLNIPAVEVANYLGVERIASKGQAAGVSSFANIEGVGLSIALGAKEVSLLELVSAYGTLANHGQHLPPVFFTSLRDKEKNSLPVATPIPREVFSSRVAWQITSILSDNKTRQPTFGHSLELPFPAAVKTGTSQDYRDAWAVGYTPEIVAGVWVGNSDNSPMYKLAGSTGAVPIWQDIMKYATAASPPSAFTPPPSVIAISTCGHMEYYAVDNVPRSPRCPRYKPPSPTPSSVE